MTVMLRFLRQLVRDVAGGPATEFALFLALVAVVAAIGMMVLGVSVSQVYSDAGKAISIIW